MVNIKNHNRFSKIGYLVGIIFMFLCFILGLAWSNRYFFIYPDINIALLGVAVAFLGELVGILIILLSYEHSARSNLANSVEYIEEQLQSKWEGADLGGKR